MKIVLNSEFNFLCFLGIESAGKNHLCAVTQGLAALIVCQVEELKSPEDTKLLEKSMQFLTEKCVEFCVKKINSNDLSYSEVMRKILKTYLGLLRDVKCLASDVFLSLPKVISPLTVMYLKKVSELNRQEEATDILQTLVSKTEYQHTSFLTYIFSHIVSAETILF